MFRPETRGSNSVICSSWLSSDYGLVGSNWRVPLRLAGAMHPFTIFAI
jgi:hypothetical protein